MIFNTNKAVAAAVTSVTAAVVGLLVALGLHVSPGVRDGIIQFESVTVPLALALIGALHHNSVKASIGGANAKKR